MFWKAVDKVVIYIGARVILRELFWTIFMV